MDLISCPVAGCAAERPRTHFACRGHWFQLRREQPEIARAVLREYRAWKGPDQSRDYFEARERGIAHLEGREPDMDAVDRLMEGLDE